MQTFSWVVNWSALVLAYLAIPVGAVLLHFLFKRFDRYRAAHLITKFTLTAAAAGVVSHAIAWFFAIVVSRWLHWGEQNLVGWCYFLPLHMPWLHLFNAIRRVTGWRVGDDLEFFYLTWVLIPLLIASLGGTLGTGVACIRWVFRRAVRSAAG